MPRLSKSLRADVLGSSVYPGVVPIFIDGQWGKGCEICGMLWSERNRRSVVLHRGGDRGSEGGPGAERIDKMKEGRGEGEVRQRGEGHSDAAGAVRSALARRVRFIQRLCDKGRHWVGTRSHKEESSNVPSPAH